MMCGGTTRQAVVPLQHPCRWCGLSGPLLWSWAVRMWLSLALVGAMPAGLDAAMGAAARPELCCLVRLCTHVRAASMPGGAPRFIGMLRLPALAAQLQFFACAGPALEEKKMA